MESLFLLNIKPARLLIFYLAMAACMAALALVVFQLENSQKQSALPHENEWLYKPVAEEYGFT